MLTFLNFSWERMLHSHIFICKEWNAKHARWKGRIIQSNVQMKDPILHKSLIQSKCAWGGLIAKPIPCIIVTRLDIYELHCYFICICFLSKNPFKKEAKKNLYLQKIILIKARQPFGLSLSLRKEITKFMGTNFVGKKKSHILERLIRKLHSLNEYCPLQMISINIL